MNIRLEYSGSGCVFVALLCLMLPMDWLMAVLIAALFHEICHVFAVHATGGTVYSISIRMTGAILEASVQDSVKQMICIIAGPLGSFSLLALADYFPKLAFCGMMQGLFNLVPIYPLDGGRLISCITEAVFSMERAKKITDSVKWLTFCGIAAGGIYGTFIKKFGVFPLLISVLFLSRAYQGKTPCKE